MDSQGKTLDFTRSKLEERLLSDFRWTWKLSEPRPTRFVKENVSINQKQVELNGDTSKDERCDCSCSTRAEQQKTSVNFSIFSSVLQHVWILGRKQLRSRVETAKIVAKLFFKTWKICIFGRPVLAMSLPGRLLQYIHGNFLNQFPLKAISNRTNHFDPSHHVPLWNHWHPLHLVSTEVDSPFRAPKNPYENLMRNFFLCKLRKVFQRKRKKLSCAN